MTTPTIAELLADPPDGFMPVHGAEAAATFAAGYVRDVERFWRECQRGDWMLALAGWCAVAGSSLVGPAARWIREVDEMLDTLEEHERVACGELAVFGSSGVLGSAAAGLRDREPGGEVDDLSAHFLRMGLYQACAVTAGPTLGPSYPLVCAQMALYPARALNFGRQPDEDLLSEAAEALREAVAAPVLPSALPKSWPDAVAGAWQRLCDAQAP